MSSSRPVLLALVVVAFLGGVVLATGTPPGTTSEAEAAPNDLETFDSRADFQEYWAQSNRLFDTRRGRLSFGAERLDSTTAVNVATTGGDGAFESQSGPRHSSTNVQVAGIGEPDLVKTDGSVAYYSPPKSFVHGADEPPRALHVLDVSPPGSIDSVAAINDSGRLLKANDTLVVLGSDAVVGYDVSDPENPERTWKRGLDGRIEGARLLDGQLFLVVGSGLQQPTCPITPVEGVAATCTDLYHPAQVVPAEATYTVTRLDATSGEPDGTLSFVGSRDSVVYMSNQSLYVTMTRPAPTGEVLTEFLLTRMRAELPRESVEHLERVQGYDLTDQARYAEARNVLDSWLASLDEQERTRMQAHLSEEYREYTNANLREFTRTQIVEVDADAMSVAATGSVPGEPLNQFALDEHEGHLRIATTVSAPSVRWQGANSSNDAYVLDDDLEIAGAVTGMSDGQEVYGVRFEGETGYVITFRRVDPLHVLDLSDPEAPEERGQLKLPGFSRYLHPLGDDRLLGIGEEDGRVKTVIFDVSEPTEPEVAHSRVLTAHFSAAAHNHHAFLRDARHEAFFLPTDYGGRILSTENLDELHRVTVNDPQRAVYVGDHLYVFGREEVSVIDERDWNRTRLFDLPVPQDYAASGD